MRSFLSTRNPHFLPPVALLAMHLLAGSTAAQEGSVVEDFKVSATAATLPFTLNIFEEFGSALASLGDLDGDGRTEVLIGSPGHVAGGGEIGAVQIVTLASDGSVAGGLEITAGTNGFVGPLDLGDAFGLSVANLGDVDGDGVNDIAVGAACDDDGGLDLGAVWILFLRSDGTVRAEQKLSATAGGFVGPLATGDSFGVAVAGIGDLDLDGVPDLAVGNPSDGTQDHGAVWILHLRADGSVKSEAKLDKQTALIGPLLGLSDRLGCSLAFLGDLDGDLEPELCVGAPNNDLAAVNAGTVFVLSLNSAGGVAAVATIDLSGALDAGNLPTEYFGQGLGRIGDIDSDGTLEIVVSGSANNTPNQGGRAWIVSLDTGGAATAFQRIDPTRDSLLAELDPNDAFATSMTGLGDLDGDGVLDLAVGAPGDDGGMQNAGAMYLLRLSDGDPDAEFLRSNSLGCAPLSVAFTDVSSGSSALTWSWSFGDGATSTQQNPTHVYASAGAYTVALSVTGSSGEAREVLRNAVIAFGAPSAEFDASVTTGAPPLAVTFSDLSTPGTTAWAWDFGDGGSSTLQNPTHVYSSAGTYSVALTASCPLGADVETKLDYIVVVSGNQASVTSSNGSGVNPVVLTSLVDPELGTTWMGQVDGGSVGATGLTFFVGYEDPLAPGFFTVFGELLIDPASAFVALDTGVLFGGIATQSVLVPNDVVLIGFTFAGQVLLNNVGGMGVLTNRLDFVLGL